MVVENWRASWRPDGVDKGFTCEACLQGEYCLSYGAVGTRVALIASEPITGQAGDWVAVPNNTALVVISEKVRLKPCPARRPYCAKMVLR